MFSADEKIILKVQHVYARESGLIRIKCICVLPFRKAGVSNSSGMTEIRCVCYKCIPSAVMKSHPDVWRQGTGVTFQDKIMCDTSVIWRAFR